MYLIINTGVDIILIKMHYFFFFCQRKEGNGTDNLRVDASLDRNYNCETILYFIYLS